MNNKILILGGMGPQASARLHQLVIDKTSACIHGRPDQYPFILHASIPIPDFISSKENEATAIGLIQSVLKQTQASSARSVCIACNTAHLLLDRLGLDASPNFVSMTEAVKEEVDALKASKVGLLASPNTINSKLYHNLLESSSIQLLTPTNSEQAQLETIIREVISGSGSDPSLRKNLTNIAKNLVDRGADCIVLGCTELPIVGIDVTVPVVDSLDALARKLVERHFVIQD